MADYTKATNFTAKDTLPTGNAAKIVKGTEIDTEFSAISNAIASKANINSPTFTGTPTAPTASSGTNTTQIATTAFVAAATSSLGTMAVQNKTAVDITGGTIVGITDLAVADGGTGRSTLTANAVLVGNGTSGINTVAPSTSGNVLTSDGTSWTSVAGAYALTSGTAVASTSGTSIDFTSIPSWVKRITVMFSDVSTNGTSEYLIQIGTSAGIQTTNYLGQATYVGVSTAGVNFSSGFLVRSDDAVEVSHGMATLCLLNSATGLFVMSYATGHSNENYMAIGAGSKTLSGILDRVRITTVNGTDTFDAGSINILYE